MNDFRRLLSYLKPHLPIFFLALVAMVFVAIFETAVGALLVPIFDQFFIRSAQQTTTLFNLQKYIPYGDWYRAWLVISVLLLVFTILKGIAEYFSSYLMAKIGQSAVLALWRSFHWPVWFCSDALFYRRNSSELWTNRGKSHCNVRDAPTTLPAFKPFIKQK